MDAEPKKISTRYFYRLYHNKTFVFYVNYPPDDSDIRCP